MYVQKPTSVDVMEGEAMVAAARKYNRVVQVGTQRKSTPHLIDAKKNIVDAGLLGKVSHVEMCCYFHMRANGNPPVEPVPAFFDYDMWTGLAPLRPYDGLPHIRWWRTFMEYGNGIMGDMCVHMFDTVRWMMGLGWPKRISSTGGIYVQKDGKSNIADTQSAVFEYDGLNCVWQHRSWGTPANPEYPWSFTLFGEKGTLTGSTMQYDFIPMDKAGQKIHKDVVYEKEKYPEDLKEEKIELNAAPATRLHMLDFLAAIGQEAGRWLTLKKVTSPRQAASLPICPCKRAGHWCTTRRSVLSWMIQRRPGCFSGLTASRGNIPCRTGCRVGVDRYWLFVVRFCRQHEPCGSVGEVWLFRGNVIRNS